MTQSTVLLLVHVTSIAFLVGGTAAIYVMRSVGRAYDGDRRLALWATLRAVSLRVQLLGLLGAFASGLFLMFWMPPAPGSHWLEAKIALAMLAGVFAHLDSYQVVRAARAHATGAAPRALSRTLTLATFLCVLAAIVLVVAKPL